MRYSITTSCGCVDCLEDGGFKHHRINHAKHFVEGRRNHINGIENFWSQSKRVLRKYNGTPSKHFLLFLKKCEFRFNYGSPRQLPKTLRLCPVGSIPKNSRALRVVISPSVSALTPKNSAA